MSIKKFINDVYSVITDQDADRHERVFIIFTLISELAILIATIGDIITGENPAEIITLLVIAVAVPTATFVGMYRKKITFAIRLIVICLILLILPALFFFGGGAEGGGALWIIFAFIYIGLMLSGLWRTLLITLLIAITICMYVIEYLHPEYVYEHTRGVFYIDSLISIILVGMVCCAMTMLQNRLLEAENKRAKKEAERAEELTRSQNRFFSSMSHEIRTPINSILGLNELILRDQNATDEIIKDSSGIQGAGKMLLALINDILDFSKIEAGSMDIVPVDYKIGDMMSEIVNMIWLRAHDKGLRFDVNIDPKVPSALYGDEVRIKQVMINLLNNAVKYTAEGSIELHVESDVVDDEHVMLSISVSDTGMGIKKEALPYLFDAFKRVDEEKNRNIEGTGLGLSIVKQLVELMGGNITVNSVYGEGSMFTVTLKQGITDHAQIGELNIHNQTTIKKNAYESSFKAPEARILIVDDNIMNLEVESKLLTETDITVDKALSGKEALDMAIKYKYDTIFMDHLMPEMDGIECLEALRSQAGGFNRATPVIVLTANAGSENRELYNRSGFDDYLVKPVSGENLEAMLVKHLPQEKLILSDKLLSMRGDISTASGYSGKVPVIITTSSVSDIPANIIKKLKLRVIPAVIHTDEGVFKDGVQMDAYELIRYIESGKNAMSSSADEAAYTEFFAASLRKAHHLIHIALTTSMSDDYKMASEAAKSFDNVTVINSGCLSSATGILVLIAQKMAQQNIPVQDIITELESIKSRLRCSFVIDTTEYMAKKGFISPLVNKAALNLNLHPCISFKDDKSIVGPIWMGSTKRTYKKYIKKAFPVDIIPDPEVLFVTYVDVPVETLQWIKEEVSKYAYFENVVFKQASAAISSNCGPGTFGILYFVKSNKSYNISSYVEGEGLDRFSSDDEHYDEITDIDDTDEWNDSDTTVDEIEGYGTDEGKKDKNGVKVTGQEWYESIDGIDAETAIKNSGSADTLKTVMKIFYDSIPDKYDDINEHYRSEDWENYTIKIHALKSSARIIGAVSLAERAQDLETAGKEKDTGYIKAHHEDFMKDYLKYKDFLSPVFDGKVTVVTEDNRPEADPFLMQSIYEGLHEAAENMDCDAMESIIEELKDYRIPDAERQKYDAITEKVNNFDYEGILTLLDEK